MSIPGTNLEDPQDPPQEVERPDPTQPKAEDDDSDEGLVETVSVGGQKMAPVAELIRYRKEARELKKQLGEQATRFEGLAQQVEAIRPYAEAIKANPALIDAVARGTHASSSQAIQHEEDTEARETAEDLGFYTADGKVDIARGRRVLDRATKAAEKKLQAEIAPLRQQTAQQAAGSMRARVSNLRDKQGQPVASEESLNEMFNLLPPELVANPQVAFVVAMAAAGMDKYAGRSAKLPQAEPDYLPPLHTESVGRRWPAGLSAELVQMAGKVGLSEKDLNHQFKTTRAGGIVLE